MSNDSVTATQTERVVHLLELSPHAETVAKRQNWRWQ